MINRIISHYRIVEKIAQGGMGVVYKAEDIHLKRFLVLKFLHPDMTRDQEAIDRFINEAQAVSKLDHPNICNIFEIDKTEDGQLFMAMSYYEGETLYERLNTIKKGSAPPISVNEAVAIAVQISKGLARAHECGIYHRDIKPGNIMITNRGEVKILDFGLAKLAGQTRITKRGSTIGTITYMSPEQAGGDTIDHRTDLWSLGVVMYEMLTTQPPFRGEMEMAVIYSILKKPPTPLSELRSDVSPELAGVVHRALEKQTGKRFQSAEEMIADLIALPEAEKFWDSTEHSNVWKKWRRWFLKWRVRMISIAFAFSLILILWLGIFNSKTKNASDIYQNQSQRIRDSNSLTILHFENHTNEAKYDGLGKNIAYLLINSMAQSKYIRVFSADQLYDILQKAKYRTGTSYSARMLGSISAKARTNYLLIGYIFKIENRFRVSVQLKKKGVEEPVYIENLEGLGEESVFQIVDDLAMRVKNQFNLSTRELADDFSRSAAQINTASNEALINYVEARELYLQRKYNDSIKKLFLAVELDPEYALAYWLIGINYSYLGNYQARNENLKKALSLLDRISIRDRLLLEGYAAYFMENNTQKAIQKYSEMLSIFPDDSNGRMSLANLYRSLENWDQALMHYRAALHMEPESIVPKLNIGYILSKKGEYDQAVQNLKEIALKRPDETWIIRDLCRYHCFKKDFSGAGYYLDRINRIDGSNPLTVLLNFQYFLMQDEIEKSDLILDPLRKMPDREFTPRVFLNDARIYLFQGQLLRCREKVDEAIEGILATNREYHAIEYLLFRSYISYISKDYSSSMEMALRAETISVNSQSNDQRVPCRFWYIRSLLEKGSLDLAGNEITRLRALSERVKNERENRYLLLLEAIFADAKGKTDEALNILKKIGDNYPQYFLNVEGAGSYLYLQELALLYKKKQKWEQAKSIYEKIQQYISGKLVFPDIYVLSYFHLGEVCDQLGQFKESRGNFKKFVQFWGESDFAQNLVAIARERSAAL